MGGSASIEFMVESAAGEDSRRLLGAAATPRTWRRRPRRSRAASDGAGPPAPERLATPGCAPSTTSPRFAGGGRGDRQIKTLVYVIDGGTALVLLRGDHALSEQKLLDPADAREIRPAAEAEIRAALGAGPGSLGAVGVERPRDPGRFALDGRRDLGPARTRTTSTCAASTSSATSP